MELIRIVEHVRLTVSVVSGTRHDDLEHRCGTNMTKTYELPKSLCSEAHSVRQDDIRDNNFTKVF